MVYSTLKQTISEIKNNLFGFFKITSLDFLFLVVLSSVIFLFTKTIVEKIADLLDAMTGYGGGTVEDLAKSGAQVSAGSIEILKYILLFLIVLFVLFVLFFGFSSYLIAKIKRTIDFPKYLKQYALASAILFLLVFFESILFGNTLYSVAAEGIYIYHYFIFAFVLVLFTSTIYLGSIMYALIPEQSFWKLFKKSFFVAFVDSKKRLMLFLILLLILFAIGTLIQLAAYINSFFAIGVFILLFFPFFTFARTLLINSVNN